METSTKNPAPLMLFARITLEERANVYEHFANLLEGGVTLLDAIDSYRQKTENYLLFQVLWELEIFIRSGDSVSLAMRKLPKYFFKDEIAIIESWEQTGKLNLSLMNLAQQLQARQDLAAKITGALMYPAIIFVILLLAMLVVMLYVMPRLTPLFTNVGMDLPWITQSLVSASDFVRSYWLLLTCLVALFVAVVRLYIITPEGRRNFVQFAFHMPAVGSIYSLYTVVKIASVLSLLIASGVPIVKSLRIAGASSGNSIGEDIMENIAKNVESGLKLAESFESANTQYQLFPRDFLQLLSAGEKTSTIQIVLEKISIQYTRKINFAIANFVKLIEPIAIVIAAVFVLWFAFAIFSAIFKITETVGV
jgi:type IV pilus assembly protein PilC